MAASLEELERRHDAVMKSHRTYVQVSKILTILFVIFSVGSFVLGIPSMTNDPGTVCTTCLVGSPLIYVAVVLVILALILSIVLRHIRRGLVAYRRAQDLLRQAATLDNSGVQ